jgi:hypothetical protein
MNKTVLIILTQTVGTLATAKSCLDGKNPSWMLPKRSAARNEIVFHCGSLSNKHIKPELFVDVCIGRNVLNE